MPSTFYSAASRPHGLPRLWLHAALAMTLHACLFDLFQAMGTPSTCGVSQHPLTSIEKNSGRTTAAIITLLVSAAWEVLAAI